MIKESKDHATQLKLWLNGTSTHNRFGYGKEDYECCPDFSCCHPVLLRPRDERQTYIDSNQAGRHRMLSTFLQAFTNHVASKVKVIGGAN